MPFDTRCQTAALSVTVKVLWNNKVSPGSNRLLVIFVEGDRHLLVVVCITPGTKEAGSSEQRLLVLLVYFRQDDKKNIKKTQL